MATRNPPISEDHLVWYAGYGSNLLRKRFDCYIKGGRPEGSTKTYPGCRDRTDPRADCPLTLRHEFFFADHSTAWNGAVGFIRPVASNATTHARMYLVTYSQFNDVVRQENGKHVPGDIIVPPYERLSRGEHWEINGVRLYGRLIRTGIQDEHPILTFTATRDDFAVGPPSEAYVKMIVSGLEETYPCMRKSEIRDYLGATVGIRDAIPGDVLAAWILGR
jgi:hypothetical protein